MIQISVGEFKVKCLKLINLAEQKHETVVITKRGIPVAKLIPYEEKSTKLFGFLKGSVVIKSDIIEPIDEIWDAEKS
jgi:prevent-host-death family protein